MEERTSTSGIGATLLAGLVLAVVAWLVFKFVIGLVMTLAWIAAAVVMLVAVIWALRQF